MTRMVEFMVSSYLLLAFVLVCIVALCICLPFMIAGQVR